MQVLKVVFILLIIGCLFQVQVSASFKKFWIKLWTPKDERIWEDQRTCDRNCRAVCIEQFNNSDFSIGSVCNKDGWCVCKKTKVSHASVTECSSSALSFSMFLFFYQFYLR